MTEMLNFSGPIPGFREMCYLHTMVLDEQGKASAALINPTLDGGLGLYLRFDGRELPYLTEWKMMGQGTYVVGMEPANCWVEGRVKERQLGTLQTLKPGETREYHLEIGVLSSQAEIQQFEDDVQGALNAAK